ncbi:hypothetical protein CANTEDRAFT_137002 [Yamadazyma tenuis ATCC 10573]|uniref:Zn(2)-C6 fungal-type domain-containing protein n=1 Tax=Candida tenuis (strain ATCC 10573 / BCRC 21748 / CBS 615 / JCM 9827 / NBRC 10315 / NRRL Y-1498 / VKM Y-70) TaxID=590646 RepID=G3BEE1_CANTC|nr:uncharacterized protein CANTEDRAFT_137002 [Yamadazyma tenuis ATCC 10573]EGV60523.1 hypothetical protein CANTEDRAFT_137002 [Yamadazyma tenuis ATCC 10573]
MDKSKIKSILPKPSPSASQSPTGLQSQRGLNSQNPALSGINGPSSRSSLPPIKRSSSSANDIKKSKIKKESHSSSKPTGHRPVTSCTFCRQHKIKCNASENYPNPCQRCERMGLSCEIDPQFRPKKGSQIQSLKSDVDDLKAKIEMLTRNETLLTQALTHQNNYNMPSMAAQSPAIATYHSEYTPSGDVTPYSNPPHVAQNERYKFKPSLGYPSSPQNHAETSPAIEEFILGDVHLPLEKANELHDRFIIKYLPFLPIINSNSATELYYKSQLLFWSVILTACLSEPEPSLYMSLSSLIRQLAIETCWIRTPRSTHVIQALIILSIWPLPNEKVLDDASYRFIGLAKNLSLQLGLHRGGEFIKEFSRTQVSLGPDSEKWRTRSWLAVFFCEQFWSSSLGLPPAINTTDYLLENARIDSRLPKSFRCLISLSIFQCKLVNVMGISVTRPDGLLEPSNRAGSLNILDRELDRLKFKLNIDDDATEIYYLYLKLMICGFAFLPGTPIEDQVKYVSSAYLSSTRIITMVSQMVNSNQFLLIELPIYVRQALSYSVFLLFKLHLSRYLIDKYVDRSRQSIVTVHRLLRNTLSSWKDLQNDISRTAKVLENLNIVLYTYPDVFNNDDETSIISKMRSHLTASLFYDLVWCVHEARRRTLQDKQNPDQAQNGKIPKKLTDGDRRIAPLPFYNQITKDDFKTIITTTPNGTTVTTLVPTDSAMNQAKEKAKSSKNKKIEINGIPLSMLEATGSINDKNKDSDGITVLSSAQSPLPLMSPDIPKPQMSSQSNEIRSNIVPVSNSMNLLEPTNNDGIFTQNSLLVDNGETTPFVNDQLDTFFQQQSDGWINNDNYQDDDFLGWFGASMMPEN